MKKTYTIKELAELGEVSRRTIRYYITRQLIPAPTGTGRGPHYHDGHLKALRWVRDQQAEGVALAEIEAKIAQGKGPVIAPSPPAPASPTPRQAVLKSSSKEHIQLAEGIELIVEKKAPKELQEALMRVALEWHQKNATPETGEVDTKEET